MIPKTIHYCWLSGDPIPANLQECMRSWQDVMPDCEIICWDQSRFDVSSVEFVKQACEVKKWAFASDYIRAYALYKEGGIYLDVDVLLKKDLSGFLQSDFFSAIEFHENLYKKHKTSTLLSAGGASKIKYTAKPGVGMQAAVMGSVAGHPFLADVLRWYSCRDFFESGENYYGGILAPTVFAMIAEDYGFRYLDVMQSVNSGMLLLPSKLISGNLMQATDEAFAVHCCAGGWRDKSAPSLLRRLFTRSSSWFSLL